MGLFDHFPYTNVHELNLDWVLSMMKALEAEWEAFTAGNSLTFADPMLHDITKTYAKNTIVLDGNGNAYVSLQAVPVGVGLQNGDYWLMVFDYEAFIEKVNKNFTARYYRGSYRATAAMAIGDWLTVDDVLYKATAAIAVDDVLEVDVNIEHFTLEDFIKAFMTSANQMIQQYKDDIDESELAYRQQLAQDIANTTASLQAQLDAAITGATVDSEIINARVGANGVTYATLGDAIRTQLGCIYDIFKGIGACNPDYTANKYITATDGVEHPYGTPNVYGLCYLSVKEGQTYLYIGDRDETQAGYAFYDISGTYISGGLGKLEGEVLTVPSGAVSAKFTTMDTDNVLYLGSAMDMINTLFSFIKAVGEVYNYQWQNNRYVVAADGTIGTMSDNIYGVYTLYCTENDIFSYEADRNETQAGYAFYDATGTYISGDVGIAIPTLIKAPANAAMVKFTTRHSDQILYLGSLMNERSRMYREFNSIAGLYKYTYTADNYVTGNDGVVHPYGTPDLYGMYTIKVAGGDQFAYTADRNETQAGYAFYDATGTYISGGLGSLNRQIVTAPNNARSAKFTTLKTENLKFYGNLANIAAGNCKPYFVTVSKDIAVVGHEWNLYFENIIQNMNDEYTLKVSLNKNIHAGLFDRFLRVLPNTEDVGTTKIYLYLHSNRTNEIIDTAIINLEIIPDATAVRKIMYLGDSLINSGYFPAEIQYNLSSGNFTSVGTIQKTVTYNGNTYTVDIEGRSGWSAHDYRTQTSKNGFTNAFYDPNTQDFSFAYYMLNSGVSQPDIVCIGLGTNGLSNPVQEIGDIKAIVANIQSYNPSIKVLIHVPSQCTGQSGAGSQWSVANFSNTRYNIFTLDEYMIANFNAADLIPIYYNLDCVYDFLRIQQAVSSRNPELVWYYNNNVHPSYYGYLKFADTYYAHLVKLIS